MRIALGVGTCVVLGLSWLAPSWAAGSAEAGKAKSAVCAGCHGADGNSPMDMWPKLAGQLPEYIKKQLHDFKSGARKNDQMTPMAMPLSEQDIADLAAYFSTQKATPLADAKKDQLAAGEKLFTKGKGMPDQVAACMGCHGPAGGGKSDWAATMKLPPTTLAPAIGEQYAGYIANQLKAFKSGSRANDIGSVMRHIAGRMSDAEITAVAAYAATLRR